MRFNTQAKFKGRQNMDPHRYEAVAAIAEIQALYGRVRFPEERKDFRLHQKKSGSRRKRLAEQHLVAAGCHETGDELRGVE